MTRRCCRHDINIRATPRRGKAAGHMTYRCGALSLHFSAASGAVIRLRALNSYFEILHGRVALSPLMRYARD